MDECLPRSSDHLDTDCDANHDARLRLVSIDQKREIMVVNVQVRAEVSRRGNLANHLSLFPRPVPYNDLPDG